MPIFEYKCNKCGAVEEHLILNKDKQPTKCRECGAKLKQIMSKNSFHLQGSGWYKTDYQRKGDQKKDGKKQ